jgi:general L-amino acid transport system substrate-binding protein
MARMPVNARLGLAAFSALLLFSGEAEAGARLDAIKARGNLVCGVGAVSPGFSRQDAQGVWSGFDVDLCRAIAAAIFGDANKAVLKPIDTLVSFLNGNDIDLVFRGLTWTFNRELRAAIRFGPIVMYDGETFLVKKSSRISDIAQLSGKAICVSQDAEFLPNLRYYFGARKLTLRPVITEKRADSAKVFFEGGCVAMTADTSELVEAVIGDAPHPEEYTILSEQITKEPLAPLLRKGDEEFLDAVRWAIFALINAEEFGITAANIDTMRRSDNPDIKYFFAAPPTGSGTVSPAWSYAAIKAVGNYGEIFERHLGGGSPAKLARGPNRLWTQGGLLYAPPVR